MFWPWVQFNSLHFDTQTALYLLSEPSVHCSVRHLMLLRIKQHMNWLFDCVLISLLGEFGSVMEGLLTQEESVLKVAVKTMKSE